MIVPENTWDAQGFNAAIDEAARDLLGAVLIVTAESLAAARQRVLQHWLAQVAPAGSA